MSNGSPHHPKPNTNILSGRLLNNRYPDEIVGPYIVLIQPTILNKDTPRMNATNTGRFLFRIFKNNEIINISSSGIHQVTVTLSSAQYANTLVELPDLPLKKLVAFIPNSCLSCDGIVREVPLDIPDAEILGSIISPIRIQSVEGLNRKIPENDALKLIPIQSIRIIFEGRARPEYIVLFSVRYPVSPWFSLVKMCFNCFLFGHISEHCKSQAKCIRCGQKKHPEGEACPNPSGLYRCANCKGPHSPMVKNCPAFIREKLIRSTAADKNISLTDARKLTPGPRAASQRSQQTTRIASTLNNLPALSDSSVVSPLPVSRPNLPLSFSEDTSTPRSPLTLLLRRRIPDADGFITSLTRRNRQRSSDFQAALATKSAHADILISRNGRLPSTLKAVPTTSPTPNHPNRPVPSSSSDSPDPSSTVATIIQLLSQLLEPTLSAAGLTDRLAPILAMLNPLLMLLLSPLHQNGSTNSLLNSPMELS